ncbi:hypothetical protein J2Z22_001163 [Paenibacillus forsythiae]|uniref:Uncharacterized protein n=1 Tax=Paenibacillus forsythiae TaxID=365616 RepID=A0ABU3H4A1_9BACL|nr:hypothetical protein [Paenibacillus forsythiae]MDT3425644.1 hypothetical protein [Paenibacillus forsythiae]
MKQKTRKMLLKKYAAIALLGTLGLLYLYLIDWMFGYGPGNILFIMRYLLYSTAEKLSAVVLLLCLIIPDIIHFITGNQSGRGAER